MLLHLTSKESDNHVSLATQFDQKESTKTTDAFFIHKARKQLIANILKSTANKSTSMR